MSVLSKYIMGSEMDGWENIYHLPHCELYYINRYNPWEREKRGLKVIN